MEPAAPTPPRAPAGRARWSIHLALIAAYMLLPIVTGLSRQAAQGPILPNGRWLLLVSAVELAAFGVALGLAWLASRASRDDLLLRWRGGLWPVPLGVAYSVALRLLLLVVVATIVGALILTGQMTSESIGRLAVARAPQVGALVDVSAMRNDPVYYWLLLTLVSFVVAGLREELWRAAFVAGLRGLWPRWFGSLRGQIGAVTIAAVFFAAAHVRMGPSAVCFAGVLGLGLGLIMVLHRSIWPAVIAHGAFDATSLASIPWAMERLAEAGGLLGQ